MTKTNAMRQLDKAKISYEPKFYQVDESDLSGMHIVSQIKMNPAQVFKTLVARGDKHGPCVFCIPVCCEVDLKKAALAAGEKRVELVPVKELLTLTGYLRGGCSPIGMKKSTRLTWTNPLFIFLKSPSAPECAAANSHLTLMIYAALPTQYFVTSPQNNNHSMITKRIKHSITALPNSRCAR